MELTVFERANLLAILPREGNFATLRTIRKLREALSLNEEENARWQPKMTDGGKMEWRIRTDPTEEKPDGEPIPQGAEVEVGEQARKIIRAELKKLDEKNALKDAHYSLYEKFVEPVNPETDGGK